MLVRDGLNTHTSRAMRELIAARDWLTVFQLPSYASELNPVEPVWSNLKRSLANLIKHDISQLTALVKTRLRRMQYRRAEDKAWAHGVARAMVGGKLRNQRALLQRFRRDRVDPPPELDGSIAALQEMIDKSERTNGRSALMGAEGFGTKRYFAGLR